jgi:hypothetical protein
LRRARRRSMHKRHHSWCRCDQALCSVNVGNPATCLGVFERWRAHCQLRPTASPAQARPADGQPRSSSGYSTGHAQAERGSRESERAPTGSHHGPGLHRQASSTPYRAAPERRLGAPAATLRCIRARRRVREQSARSPPLRGGPAPPRAARARLVVELVSGIPLGAARRYSSARRGDVNSSALCHVTSLARPPRVPMGQIVHSARPRRRRGHPDAW